MLKLKISITLEDEKGKTIPSSFPSQAYVQLKQTNPVDLGEIHSFLFSELDFFISSKYNQLLKSNLVLSHQNSECIHLEFQKNQCNSKCCKSD